MHMTNGRYLSIPDASRISPSVAAIGKLPTRLAWNPETARWTIRSEQGTSTSDHVVPATGAMFHSSQWIIGPI